MEKAGAKLQDKIVLDKNVAAEALLGRSPDQFGLQPSDGDHP